jgi:hypothetical protein
VKSRARERDDDIPDWPVPAIPPGARLALFAGAGLGHVFDRLERTHPTLTAIVFEPDPATASALLARRDWSAWAGRLAMLTGPDYAGAGDLARLCTELPDAPFCVYPPLQRDAPAEVARVRQLVDRVVFGARANDSARRATAGRYLIHTLANAPRIAREGDAASLAGLGAGTPAIVVAAGPSLDRNIHDLARVHDRAIVIACDTAARPLVTVGLDPDLIVASDSSQANAQHLSSLPPTRAWLAGEASLHPSAFTHFDGRTFMFRVADHEPWPWLKSIGFGRAHVETWGSVATSAFTLALSLGCDPIVLAGADFAFTDGRPYCRGTSFEPIWASWAGGGASYDEIWRLSIDRWPAVTEPDVAGAPVRTTPHLLAFRDWIAGRAARSAPRRIVNATGGGTLAGPAIEQRTATDTLGGRAAIDRDALHDSLRRAHNASRGSVATLFKAIEDVVERPEPQVPAPWLTFTGGAVSGAAVAAALQSHEYRAWRLARAGSIVSQAAS